MRSREGCNALRSMNNCSPGIFRARISTETCASPEFLELYEKACNKTGLFHKNNQKTDTKGYMIMGDIEEYQKYCPKEEDKWQPPEDFDIKFLKRYIPVSQFRNLVSGAAFDEEMRKVRIYADFHQVS